MLSQSRLVSHSIGFFCTYDSILVHEGKRNIGNQVVMSFFFFFFLIGKKERKKERNIKSILNPKSALRNKCALRVHRPTTLEKKRGGRTSQKASTIGKPMGGTTTCTQTYLLVPHTYRSITPPPSSFPPPALYNTRRLLVSLTSHIRAKAQSTWRKAGGRESLLPASEGG
jgi:hypothetical protein